jgi:protein-disulfide isomerase
VRLVFKDFPLPFHQLAPAAHAAARCAVAAGKYWPYHDRLFAEQPAFERPELIRYAADLGLEAAAFTACLDSPATREAVQADVAEARALGIRGTPTFLINGTPLVGAHPIDAFREQIDAALGRSDATK